MPAACTKGHIIAKAAEVPVYNKQERRLRDDGSGRFHSARIKVSSEFPKTLKCQFHSSEARPLTQAALLWALRRQLKGNGSRH